MVRRLPVVSGKRVVRALQKHGFEVRRISGSHHLLRHPGPPVRNVTVPVHGNKPLKRATLASIIRQAGLSVDAFVALL
ncbi:MULTISPECIES: type II toxin-antitoxin system HicA family toxin [unclassified Roseitalea]|uniref:type II toxin-antitoxin system HicA family toxin n=1 Tax=unclassified Roseitalea TaxID=2639107 RepID=UPI00273EB19D|nr:MULTISPECIES: type II toxin-antitoxin system HicA family toxin [unclassified Roseitalea]